MADERPYSSIVVDGVEQAPSRAMLYPTGFTTEASPLTAAQKSALEPSCLRY